MCTTTRRKQLLHSALRLRLIASFSLADTEGKIDDLSVTMRVVRIISHTPVPLWASGGRLVPLTDACPADAAEPGKVGYGGTGRGINRASEYGYRSLSSRVVSRVFYRGGVRGGAFPFVHGPSRHNFYRSGLDTHAQFELGDAMAKDALQFG
jgi:hypothetical protein